MPVFWLPIALAAVLSPSPQGDVPQEPAVRRYRVTYHHAVTNRTKQRLEGVVVYLPVPVSDDYQTVSGFRVLREAPVQISNRSARYGLQVKRLALPPLEPGQRFEVGFAVDVALAEPVAVDLTAPASDEPIPEAIAADYLGDDPVFGLEHPSIREHSARFQRRHDDPTQRALAIHDFVASTLRYASGDGWDPAPVVLERKSGSCSEFSYLFAALCRGTGLPTRFVGASIFPQRSKAPFEDRGWHRWVEVWLPGRGWVPFDPTLDRGRPAKRAFAGTHHGRVLIVSRLGARTTQLGLTYIGANSKTGETSRARWFTWVELPD